ncbi:hypothetical protein WAI453_002840 [Rhynchosporium graminicola]|uniref:Related to chloroperoxidase n=1 Tax=Rhynchosporium graminicola TaxID=2792576 RepID=A0A1E1JZV1_9HELO|nr:related to chloroperoxidase [Rhynchosporium commune]
MFTFSLTLFSLLSLASSQSFMQWIPAGPNDLRSPCPGLNSLANHGFIPHNGKGLTIPVLIKGLKDGLNVGADFSTAVGNAGLLSVPNNLLAQSFTLKDIRKHNFPIEHDASLSRADFNLNNGDNWMFNQSIFDTVLQYYDGMTETSIPVASAAKYNRVRTEQARDKKFTYTPQQYVLSYGETALYLSTMGNPVTGVAPVEYVKVLFEEERLPYNEGWRPTASETNLVTLGAMILQLIAANKEALPEGLEITTNTLKIAFGGYNPITGLLDHIL